MKSIKRRTNYLIDSHLTLQIIGVIPEQTINFQLHYIHNS